MSKKSQSTQLVLKILKVFTISLLALVLLIAILFGYKDIPLSELKNTYANASSSFIPVEGMEVHYRDEGPRSDSIPLVLIHGTGSSLHTFDAWTNALSTTHRVIRLDLPGYGLTGPFPNRDYSMENYVNFLDSFINAIGVEQCILGGNSLGGGISWRYTLKQPEKVNQLILIDASGYPIESVSRPLAFELAELPVIKNVFTFITPKSVARKSVENVYADKSKVTDDLVERYFNLTLREGNRQAFVDRLAVEHQSDAYKSISTIEQRTLIIWGDKDELIPVEMAYRFHEDLPNNKLIILENQGHVPMEESPSLSLKALIDFLDN